MPRPLHLLPLAAPTYPDKRVEFGVERCYAVVTLDVVSELEIRSAFSAPTCVTFLDTFAPTAPTGLNAVGSEGAVSLSWQPNEEEDLVGYLVLRGVAPGDRLYEPREPKRAKWRKLILKPALQLAIVETLAN